MSVMRKPVVGSPLLFKILLVGSLGLSSYVCLAQLPVNVSGTWKVTSSFGNAERQNQISLVALLHQNGNEITGSAGPSTDNQILTISNGKIAGNAVSFDVGNEVAKMSISIQIEGGDATGEFNTSNTKGITIQGKGTGQVQANQMTFEWSSTRNDGQQNQGKIEFTKTN